MLRFENKGQILKNGDSVLELVKEQMDSMKVLRAYNKWYTEAQEFVKNHAPNRFIELESLHINNQSILCHVQPNIQSIKVNLTIQIAIIEGSSDHTVRAVCTIG